MKYHADHVLVKETREEDYKNNNKDDIEAGLALGHPKYEICQSPKKERK